MPSLEELGALLTLGEGERFEGNPLHEYWRGGELVPSVTQILSAVGLSEGYDHVPVTVLDNAADRGNILHEAWHLAMEDDLDFDSIHEAYRATVRSARDELLAVGYEPIAHECPLIHSRWGYSGTPDRVCRLASQLAVVDGKSGPNPYGYVAAQGAGYVELVRDKWRGLVSESEPIGVWLLRFDWRRGRAELSKVPGGSQDFLAALRVVKARSNPAFWQKV